MNTNAASIDPSRHCVHNNVALCALTFKIVVLAWNRSSHQQAREIQSFVVSDPLSQNGSLLTGQTLYADCSFPWIKLILPSRETTLDGRFTMNHFHFHFE